MSDAGKSELVDILPIYASDQERDRLSALTAALISIVNGSRRESNAARFGLASALSGALALHLQSYSAADVKPLIDIVRKDLSKIEQLHAALGQHVGSAH